MTEEQKNAIAIAVMQAQLEHMRESIDDLTKEMRGMRKTMDEAKGGWRTLILLGGAVGAISSAVTWVAAHWRT